ncbi:THAP domain-containing protein 8-like, partial [Polyodon spathula]|uniref:THAP domain-containing protein 8-like n=1 Tax=Polyodon spathula TaxID=7913 RepID=UPI001B7E658F
MPKYCTAPNCNNSAGQTSSDKKISFYKYPLHEPGRLKRWLTNMKRENWTPSKHQHLCNEHFTPSCFDLRWGIRYLTSDAVPTVFDVSDSHVKRKSSCSQRPSNPDKRPKISSKTETAVAPREKTASGLSEANEPSTLQVYTIAIDPSMPGQPVLVEAAH